MMMRVASGSEWLIHFRFVIMEYCGRMDDIFDARSWTDIIWMTFGGLTVGKLHFAL